MLGQREDLPAGHREVLAADGPAPLLGALLVRADVEPARQALAAALGQQHPVAERDRALEVRVRGHPGARGALLRQQPARAERPAHEPRARLLVGVLADHQRVARLVDRGEGEAQGLAVRAVAGDLGEHVALVAGRVRALDAGEVEHAQALLRLGHVEQVLAPGQPARVGADGLARGGDERDVAVAAGLQVDERHARGARGLVVPGDEHDAAVRRGGDALRVPRLRPAVLAVPAEAAAQPVGAARGPRRPEAGAERADPAVEVGENASSPTGSRVAGRRALEAQAERAWGRSGAARARVGR